MNSIYGYDNKGNLTWEWYPNDKGHGFDSPNLLYDYDAMKRLTGIRRQIQLAPPQPPGSYSTTTLASGATYGPAGNPLTMNYLGYSQTRSYNTLQQLTRIQASGAGLLSFDEEYKFVDASNNGRITKSIDAVTGEEVNYAYDSLNRLISAYTTGTQWGVNFTYDGFGNKTDHTGVAGKLAYPPLSITVNPANNRVTGTGVTYDNNGNLTGMPGGATFAYDVENRVTGADGLGYSYGADNRRVWDGSMYTFWSVTGQRIGRYAVSGTQVDMNPLSDTYMQQIHQFATAETKLYFGGMLVGEGAGVNGTSYTAVVVDRLGSVRVRGAERYAFYPYGEERVATAQGRDKFATYLRDANGVDYADQRYFTSQWGRFLTADPAEAGFNLYTYVDGDPINFLDPEGLDQIATYSWNTFRTFKQPASWSFSFTYLGRNPANVLPSFNLNIFNTQARPRAARSGINKEDRARDAIRNRIYAINNDPNFTARHLDCLAGIETRWSPNSVARTGNAGLYQLNLITWNSTNSGLGFKSNVKNVEMSTMVAVAALYTKARGLFPNTQAGESTFNSLVSVGSVLPAQVISGALQLYRGSGISALNLAYANAITNCAAALAHGDFQKAMDWISWYGDYDRNKRYLPE